MSAFLQLRDISKSYGGVRALSDVSFRIKSWSVNALVVENGVVKSTLAGPGPTRSTGNVVNVDGGVTAAYPRWCGGGARTGLSLTLPGERNSQCRSAFGLSSLRRSW